MTLKLGGQFETYNDPMGNPLIALNRDGTVFTQGIDFGDGTKQTTAGSGATLQTNGTPNSIQTLLNLAGSGGITVSNSAGTTTISGSGAGGVLTVNAPVSSAQILAGSAALILAAPGVGKYYNIINVTMEYIAGNTAYTDNGGGTADVQIGNQVIASIPMTGPPAFMTTTTSQVALNGIQVALGGFASIPNLSALSNQAVNFVMANPPINGDGTLKISVQYTIETA